MTPIRYYLELFDVEFYFFVDWTEASYIDYVEREFKFKSEEDYTAGGTTELIEREEDCPVIACWSRKGRDHQSVMVHEAVHAASLCLDWVGVHADHENDEALAYLAELIWTKAIYGTDATQEGHA